ncbi:MAG: cob(I)yrinic acid a,c-diamide adenosyltransferase [Ruminococcaceae bacterium]|nr:cob(I)yrinic acid a,c-diamide adenosyltransferase [Oscillospiraceae bacterium]
MTNCLHIYTGDGKGKTTACMGLALRFLSGGGRVLILQFMKGSPSGEIPLLEKLGASVKRLSKNYGFYPFKQTSAVIEEHNRLMSEALSFAQKGEGLLILDEIISAYSLSLLCRSQLLELLRHKNCEIVCTGRNAPPELIKLADYITEMKNVRHPYASGLGARKGIEY